MYIPKYPIVDVHELEKEMGLDSDTIVNGLSDFLGPWAIEGETYIQDFIRTKYDDNWDTIPKIIKDAYRYLRHNCHMEFGDWFLWLRA